MAIGKEFNKDTPMLTTAVVADMLEITPDRLRTYDTEKLIETNRVMTGQIQKRLYSQNDVEWLHCLRILFKDHKMSVSSVKILLQILYLNQKSKLPKNAVGEVLCEMLKNPNFKKVVRKF